MRAHPPRSPRAGGYPIYGIQFYGDDPPAEATIQNGQGMTAAGGYCRGATDWTG